MTTDTSHLTYYTKHGITPVTYEMTDLSAHLERRESLYRSLGLLALTIRGADVLEVAAGTGQNSLFLASCAPRSLTLVEPNPAGLAKLTALYAAPPLDCVAPIIVSDQLEAYAPDRAFDIVVCENWLGRRPHELALLRKLSTFVRPGGLLVVTAISPIGLIANMVRRALASRLVDPALAFETRTERLAEIFGPHLASMTSMTRSARDWVQDNMMNPAYFDLAVTIPQQMEQLGARFEIVGTNPVYAQDWRWFKSLHGPSRAFSEHHLGEYWRNAHGFFDHRETWSARAPEANRELEARSLALIDAVRDFEAADTNGSIAVLSTLVEDIGALVAEFSDTGGRGLREAAQTLRDRDVQRLSEFNALFGRETLYVSFMNRG